MSLPRAKVAVLRMINKRTILIYVLLLILVAVGFTGYIFFQL